MTDAIDALIPKIYEAPLRLEAWGEALAAVATAFSAGGSGQFHIFDMRHRRMAYSIAPPGGDEANQLYNEQFAATDPRRALVDDTQLGEWVFDQDHFDERFVRRSDVFQFLRRYDIRYAAATKISADDAALMVLAIFRAPGQAPFDDSDRKRLALLSAHLVQAAKLTTHVSALRRELSQRNAALDAIRDAVMVVDRHMRIVFNNTAAEGAFMKGSPLESVHGRLNFVAARNQHAIRAAIARAIEKGQSSSHQLFDNVGRNIGMCRVLALPEGLHVTGAHPGSNALVVFNPTEAREAQVATVASLFGLTPYEAEVAQLLATGATPRAISEALGKSLATVRTQMQHIFRKTQTRRQSELIALLKSG